MVSPMPETCWFAPNVTVMSAMTAPAPRPTAIAAPRPSSGDPVAQAVTKPANAPAYIVPSIPRLRTPLRSAYVSPTVPYTSGVALRSVAASRSTRNVIHGAASGATSPVAEGVSAPSVRRNRLRRSASSATVVSSSTPCTTAPSWDGMPSDRAAELAPTVRSPMKSAASVTPGIVSVPRVATTMPV